MRSALLVAALLGLAAAEEEVASPVACAIAATLFGFVFVIMCLYYLFNWPDPDIRRYAYEVVSATISIFCAVLLFQSFQNTIEYFMDGQPTWIMILAAFVHRLWWHAILQFLLAFITKSIFKTDAQREEIIQEGEEAMSKIELNAKCWGTLLAHMTGFASINAWGTVQQTAWFAQNWYCSWLVVPACFITNIPWLNFTNWVREKISMSGDGETDELEKKWDEEVEEAENDITALGLSFLTVQSVKFAICGILANVEGEEEEALTFGHSVNQCALLYLFGTFCIPVFCFFVMKLHTMEGDEKKKEVEHRNHHHELSTQEAEEDEKEESEDTERRLDQTVATFAMCMAWSYFYATKWSLGMVQGWQQDTTLLTLVEAVVVSVVCFSLIFCLDKLADAEWTPTSVDECIVAIILAISILVGFSWEQCFDASVGALGSRSPYPIVTKQMLAVACSLVVVPAWKLYMLPVIVNGGWRFGFIASQATKFFDEEDKEATDHYFAQLKHLVSGHGGHVGNPELKKMLKDCVRDQLEILEREE